MKQLHRYSGALLLTLAATACAVPPTTAPGDPTLDWLMSQATTQPTGPTTQPAASPITKASSTQPGAITAKILLSDGTNLTGIVTTTPGKPIRIWDESIKEYRDIPLSLIRSAESTVLWEREDPEWRFKDGGSDIKEFSGKTYPVRELAWTVILLNKQKIEGSIAAPLYLELADGTTRTIVLHKRDKGDAGQTLKDLVFVKRVDLGP